MPVVSSQGARRARFVAAFALVAGFVGCSFPEHTFVEDSEFYGTGAAGGGTGATGGGGTGATGGSGTGATGGGGTGATGGGGTGATGATGGGGTGATGGGGTGATGGTGGTVSCTGGQCVPDPPSGWDGPVVYYEGAAGAPACPSGYPTIKQTASSAIDKGTPACPTCSCGTPSGATCQADVVFFDAAACGGSGCWGYAKNICQAQPPNPDPPPITITSSCKAQNLCWTQGKAPGSAIFVNLVAGGGTCASSSTGTKNIPVAKYSNTVRACGNPTGATGSCASGTQCVPDPPSGFSPDICIYQTGDVACPGGAWTKKSTFYTGAISETRDCSACTCGTVTGTCTGASLEIYSDQSCTQGKTTVTAANMAGCTDLQADSTPIASPNCNGGDGDSRSMKVVGGTASGTCTPAGGQVTGDATGQGPVTFCCL